MLISDAQKIYGKAQETGEVRYSPAQCMGAKRAVISGMPELPTYFNKLYGAAKT